MQFQQMRFVVHLCLVGVVLREHMVKQHIQFVSSEVHELTYGRGGALFSGESDVGL